MKSVFALIFALLISPLAMSADGSSGCGPGWFVAKDNSLVSSALRATTNGILFPVMTIGMTVGTSNCTKHSIVRTEQESLHFATMNFHELKVDVARGEGNYVSTFSSIIGCESSAQTHFGNAMKKNYGRIFSGSANQPEKVLSNVYEVILTDKVLADKCSLHLS